ncbi:MAG: energy-coupling factor transporter ATPase [Clostridia bacterium]|nr:energy-coupling factor transporter ATPase [Clostridia bacterium]
MNKELITLRHVMFSYENDEGAHTEAALKDISFSVHEGEYIAIIGHNGSGKSTLAKLMNLILQPTEGELVIDGISITNAPLSDDTILQVRRKVGMVFQNPDNQLVATIVEEDVAFGPENLGLTSEEIALRVKSSLEMVGMTDYAGHAPHKLSGGQKQRVAIAGVLAMRPACIIFDESTAMLDPQGRKDILATMKRLHQEGMAIVHITHHMSEAIEAERILVVDDGVLVDDGTPEDVFRSPARICNFGLEVPQGADLVARLRQKGVKIEGDCLRADDCVREILAFLKGGTFR